MLEVRQRSQRDVECVYLQKKDTDRELRENTVENIYIHINKKKRLKSFFVKFYIGLAECFAIALANPKQKASKRVSAMTSDESAVQRSARFPLLVDSQTKRVRMCLWTCI